MSEADEGQLEAEGRFLLEQTVSESKRIGRREADAVGLAVLLAKIDPDRFDGVFGEDASKRLTVRAFRSDSVGDHSEIVGLLLKAQTDEIPPVELLDSAFPDLRSLLDGQPPAEAGPAVSSAASVPDQDRSVKEESETRSRQRGSGKSGAADRPKIMDPEAARAELTGQIKGQDQAVDSILRRLMITRTNLDLRPERPDGVFMFVGPTGVGKTELARALARTVMGSEEALIRLDMSEYSDGWAISRITGPMQGYVGSDRPESWLTTRVIRKPHSVILLDEVEKASPTVWNVFLQAFDAGRLTDSRGKTANFSETIVIMTSNLGAEVFTDRQVGFVSDEDEPEVREGREEAGLNESIRRVLPIELINRIDEVITFRALERNDIEIIARNEIERLVERYSTQGLHLTVAPEVSELVAATGYDRKFGARHLHRNIESLLISRLAMAGRTSGEVKASLKDGQLEIS